MVQRAAWLGFVWALLVIACDDQATQPVASPHINLVFTGQPSNTFAGATFTPPILIQAEDLSGYRVDTFTGNVTIAIATNPGGGTLSGTRTVVASNGVATFRDLSIDAAGNGYTLVASAAGLDEATSTAFNAVYLPPCLTNNCWTVQAPMPTVRSSFGIGTLNGILYTIGGSPPEDSRSRSPVTTVEAYDPSTNGWTTKAPMPTARSGPAVVVVDGLLYAIGGIPAGLVHPLPTGTVEAYDPVTNAWTTKQPMPVPQLGFTVGLVNGTIYAVGGRTFATGLVSGEVKAYDPVSNTWTTKAPMPTPRLGASVGTVNGIMYAVGGYVNGSSGPLVTGAVEAYDPLSNTWTAKAPMLTPRAVGVGVVNGIIYAVGGYVDNPPGFVVTGTVEAYDPLSNTWTAKAPMVTPRGSAGVGVVNGVLYAIGGEYAPVGVTGANEAYRP
jgi:N-acetylneuraminic acid mutarotase